MMTLAQLKTFLTVARQNSFSRAAEDLHLTQPAVSAQVVALEDSLKIKLFDRMGRKIALTEPGQVVLAAAEDILNRIAQMHHDLEDLVDLISGTLHIGASLAVGVYLLPEILARFKEKYPGIDLVVRVDPARQIVDLIGHSELDVGIIGEGASLSDPRLAVKPVLRDELVLIVPPDHPLASKATATIDELAHYPFVLPTKDTASGESVLEQVRAAGIDLNSVMELSNIGAVKHAVEAGLGISIVSRFAVVRDEQQGLLKCLRVEGIPLERPLSLCWYHGKRFSKATTAFVHFVQEYLRENCADSQPNS